MAPKFLEDKLKKQYPGNPGAVFGTMNKIGAMNGNKITPKGRSMEAKHRRATMMQAEASRVAQKKPKL